MLWPPEAVEGDSDCKLHRNTKFYIEVGRRDETLKNRFIEHSMFIWSLNHHGKKNDGIEPVSFESMNAVLGEGSLLRETHEDFHVLFLWILMFIVVSFRSMYSVFICKSVVCLRNKIKWNDPKLIIE